MKNLCSGTQYRGFQFLLILDLWSISFHALIVFGLGKNILFKSVLGHCELRFHSSKSKKETALGGSRRALLIFMNTKTLASVFDVKKREAVCALCSALLCFLSCLRILYTNR